MKFIETKLKGCFILEPKIIKDERGYFMESFNEKTFQEGIGQKVTFVQDNQSFSSKGVLRGLHYQCGVHAQAKLELWGEGKSYLAMKRNKATVTRGANHLSNVGIPIPHNDERLTFEIPNAEIQNNPFISSQND